MDVWYTGYNKDMALEFIEDAADWARHYELAAARIEEFVFVDEKKDIQAFRLRFASGWKVVALSSRPSNRDSCSRVNSFSFINLLLRSIC